MLTTRRILFFSALFIFFGIFCGFLLPVRAGAVNPPLIVELGQYRTAGERLQLVGLTPANTEILVYLDGVYVGLADVNREGTATDNFFYSHPLALSAGEHTVKVIAQDRTSLVLSLPVETAFFVSALPAPTLVSPNETTIIGKAKPLITGLATSGSFVHVYIDGVLNGQTDILEHESGTANFVYRPFLNLAVGWHEVYALAEDAQGNQSGSSQVLKFKIEEPMPAPTLFTPVVNDQTSIVQPFVVGLAKNDSLIKVYVDKQFLGQFKVRNHESGTANFAYRPSRDLARGRHLVYTIALDDRGKESSWSNIIYFNVREPAITPLARESQSETVDEIKEPVSISRESAPIISPAEGLIQEKASAGFDQETGVESENLGENFMAEEQPEILATGMINESRKKQSKISLNLIIFIVFLLAIIAWIIWVNRELVKERQTRVKTDQEGKQEKIDKIPSEEADQNQDKLL